MDKKMKQPTHVNFCFLLIPSYYIANMNSQKVRRITHGHIA